MKLKNIIAGQAVRFIRLHEPIGGIYIPDLVKAIQGEYKFLTSPKSLADFDRNKGIVFENGVFKIPAKKKETEERSIVLDRLHIYNNGLMIETRGYVEDAEHFLDHLIEWSIRVLGVRLDTDSPIASTFLSNLEVQMDNPLTAFQTKATAAVSKILAKQLSDYGLKVAPYEQVGLSMYVDVANLKAPYPGNFRLDRRDGVAFDANVFFSSAPLRTQDHLDLLQQIESML